ncbi:Hypothetical predicted protein [Olea europaea subsp. europaea]|uniref:Protein TIFY n=1 Tax=Olea europaea subsp. europaea TaxID=158383 RepID=A0A8S0SQZ7_OLEEU|nr:Hypothetical predicted protein [Olea europaea subsp. europaea]
MSKLPVEVDFFRMERERNEPPISVRKRRFRDIQGIVSRLNPQIVKTVIQSASFGPNEPIQTISSPLRPSYGLYNSAETEKMTIVYNGKVFDFDLSALKVHNILKIAAEEKLSKSAESTETEVLQILCEQDLSENLPMARRKTLLGFLDKRKGR